MGACIHAASRRFSPSFPPSAARVLNTRFWPLSAWYFCYFAFLGAFNTYFGLYLKSVGISAWHIGVLLSLYPVMRLVAPNFWGWLADRWGTRARVVRYAMGATLVAFAGILGASDFWSFLAVIVVFAFFGSASLPLVEALTLAHLQHRIERYGRIRLWGSIGFILTVQGVGLALDWMPISSLIWICLGILGTAAVSSLQLAEAPAGAAHPAGEALAGGFRNPEMLALLAACFMMSAAHSPLYVFYSIHLVDHGYAKTAVGALWALGVVAEILVFLAMPRLMRRLAVRTILAASFAIAVLRFLLIGWAIDFPLAVALAQVMHGATFGACHAAAVAALNRWYPARQQARAQALYSSASFGAGGLIGGLFSGYAWEALGAGPTYTIAATFAAGGLWMVLRGLRPQ
ncbi:hypothetical protein B9N43_07630 [Denitratisoma sp. DHT3]|nr:hypothetical protein B9N43_07630 [Denitratisoma sp. DHT3]